MASPELYGCLLGSLVPGAAAVVSFAAFFKDTETLEWWQSLKKPPWAPSSLWVYSAIDLLSLAPLGCAAYLVFKHGGGFEWPSGSCVALGVFMIDHALQMSAIPIMQTKNIHGMYVNTLFSCASASLTSLLFYRIHHLSGLLSLAHGVWLGFYVCLFRSVYKLNQSDKND